MMILVNGGSSSGKSAFAESLILEQDKRERAEENKTCPSWYLATMIAWDEECRERIRKHRNIRAEKNFRTIECPVDLETAEIPAGSRCLLECVSNLAANEMYRGDMKNPEEHAKERILAGIEKVRRKSGFFVIVTNDVSGDQGAYSEETEEYRNLLGEINIALAGEADEVYEVLCGIPVKIKTAEKNTAQREDKEKMEHMTDGITLITGGAHQGKAEFAMKRAVENREDRFICAADGEKTRFADAFNAEVILNLHIYIRRMIKDPDESGLRTEYPAGNEENCGDRAEECMYRFLDEILEKNPAAVITCDEIGCGIVPVDADGRLWREMTGDACQYLAARAGTVFRVVCGIPVLLKGGEQ